MSIAVKFDVLNTKNSPSIGADTFANRPTSAANGAIYITTDTNLIYRWNGSAWVSIGGGGISGSGTINKLPVWTGSGALGDSDITYTTSGAYPTKFLTSGSSFEAQFAAPTSNGQAAGWIIRRTSDNNIIGMLYGQDTTLSSTGSSNIFHHYIQDNYFIKVFSGATNFYHSFFKNGRVVINGYTDASYQFDIQGTFRTTGIATIYDSAFAFTPVTIKGNSSDGSIYIGGSSMLGNNSPRNVVINPINSYTALTGSSNVIIGRSASNALTSGSQNIFVGTGGNSISTGNNNILLSSNLSHAFQAAQSGMFIVNTNGNAGTAGVDFDYPTTSNFTSIGGYSNGAANNQFYFGAAPFINQTFGTQYSAITFFAPSGIGTNIYGGDFYVAAGRGTGNATSGDFIIQTSTIGSSGSTLQTLSSRWFVKGNTGILSNQSSTNASALVDLYSTTQGLGVMSMTTTQKNAIASPRAGLMIFDSTLGKMCIYTGSAWQTITSV
jgi:hypothetical protein